MCRQVGVYIAFCGGAIAALYFIQTDSRAMVFWKASVHFLTGLTHVCDRCNERNYRCDCSHAFRDDCGFNDDRVEQPAGICLAPEGAINGIGAKVQGRARHLVA